jgi:phytoene desaturase
VGRSVVVVGAGLGGLSAACRLAGAGYEVTVLEAGERPGGRAGRLDLEGYTFDTGPTVLTMIDLVEACFASAGVEMADLLDLVPVDPMYRACFADGTELRVRHGRDAMRREIQDVCGQREAGRFDGFCDWLTQLYELEMPHFIARNYDSPVDLVRPPGPAVALLRLRAFRRLSKVVGGHFDDDRLRRIFTFQSMYAGLAPYEALALYGVITYMDAVAGVYVPRGGMHALPTALADAAAKAGAVFRYGAHVDRITTRDDAGGPVTGVQLSTGETLRADRVVCNADLPVAYRQLLPHVAMPRVARRGTYSPSCVVWHAGVRGDLPAGTEHHNIHFGREWDSSFRALMHDGRPMPDPSILVTVPTRTQPELAPRGGHALYVLEPMPNLDGHVDWSRHREAARERLAGQVAALGYPGDVEVEAFVDPADWQRLGMERGTPFALSHRFFQTGPFRPANVDPRVPGLAFVGSGTQPGVGIPMVLVSGQLAAQRIQQMDGAMDGAAR